MPRFNPNKYDPAKESSPGLKTPGQLTLLVKVDEDGRESCPCGCGEFPEGKKAKFLMGHDARYRGKLIRAHLTDTPVEIVRRDLRSKLIDKTTHTAEELAKVQGWESYLEAAELRREGKNREVLGRAVGSKRLIKVGRWQYTGQVMAVYETPEGNDYEVEYVTKQGEVKKTRVPARQTEAVK